MSREQDRDQELREAAKALALELKYVDEDHNGQLVDQFVMDDEDDEGMEAAREDVQALMDEENELVEAFEGDIDLALEYIGKILEDAQPG